MLSVTKTLAFSHFDSRFCDGRVDCAQLSSKTGLKVITHALSQGSNVVNGTSAVRRMLGSSVDSSSHWCPFPMSQTVAVCSGDAWRPQRRATSQRKFSGAHFRFPLTISSIESRLNCASASQKKLGSSHRHRNVQNYPLLYRETVPNPKAFISIPFHFGLSPFHLKKGRLSSKSGLCPQCEP